MDPRTGMASGEAAIGGTEAFEAFFDAHRVRLFRTLALVTGDLAEAEELMQEAFAKVWERWDRVRAVPDPPGYLYRTAFNLSRNRIRSAVRARRRSPRAVGDVDPFAAADARADVWAALRVLTPRQRSAVVLTELLEMSSEEAGRVLGVRPGTVRALSSQARSRLREALGDLDE
jgi:RNA polymerase sigma-70 factor (ECF subfamily)